MTCFFNHKLKRHKLMIKKKIILCTTYSTLFLATGNKNIKSRYQKYKQA